MCVSRLCFTASLNTPTCLPASVVERFEKSRAERHEGGGWKIESREELTIG